MNTDVTTDDAGVSLIELIIYALLVSIVLMTTTLILINSWNTQKDVTSVSEATNRGQSMGATIERAMRNALAYEVTNGTELRVRTSLGGNLECQGFLLTDGMARMALSSGALSAPGSWTEWEDGIMRDGTAAYFSDDGITVEYNLKIRTEGGAVRIAGESSPRTVTSGVSAPCW